MAAWNAEANDLFLSVLEIPSPDKRRLVLGKLCRDNDKLRAEVEALLNANEAAGSFLEKPAPSPNSTRAMVEQDKAPACLEIAGTRLGQFKLLQEIGEGGMGTVFMAEQQEPVRRMVALKVIKPGMDSKEVLARFTAERQALALMDHPNIAKVLDAGTTDTGRLYFVMELVKGIPINKYCDEHQLSPRERLELFIPVCQAIQHAHQKGIIHRDIKPSNILVANYDSKPVPKVIDFGVAKATGRQLTEHTLFTGFGGIVGTLEYMSPEQAQFNALDIDTRSDVYSLGVLLYELLVGSTPLSRKRLKDAVVTEALRLIREEDPPRPSTRLSTSKTLTSLSASRKMEPAKLTNMMRGELDWIVMKALDKDRNRRYETANGLARDVERYLRDEQVEACPPSAGYRLRKLARRYKTPVALVATFVFLLAAGVIVSSWQAVRATGAEASAMAERDRALQAERDVQTALAETQKAKTATEQALKSSDEAREQSEAVSNFLVEVFRSPDPSKDGREIKVADLLDKAAAVVEGNLAASAKTKGELLEALGKTYTGLGLPAKAVEAQEKALGLRKQALGDFHPTTLKNMNYLASAYQNAGRRSEALKLHEETLRLQKDKLGPDHFDIVATMISLATDYLKAGRHKEAIALLEQAIEIHKAKRGPDHPHTYLAMNQLGVAYQATGRNKEATDLFERVFAFNKATLGPNHPDTLTAMFNVAFGYARTGRPEESAKLHKETLELRKATLGPHHPSTLHSMNNLAMLYKKQPERLAEATELYVEALKGYKATLGSDHPDILNNLMWLARVYFDSGRYEEAIPYLEEALRIRRANGGPGFPQVLPSNITSMDNILQNLAANYRNAGRLADAIPLFEEVLKVRTDFYGLVNGNTIAATNDLAAVYRRVGRVEEAIALHEKNVEHSKARWGPEHDTTLSTLSQLAESYQAANRLAEAAGLFERVLKVRTAKLDPDHVDIANSSINLGKVLVRLNRCAEAEPVLRECLEIRTKKTPDDWLTFNAKSILGHSLLGQKKYAEAELQLLEGYEGMKQREAKIDVAYRKARLTEALDRLIELYDAIGDEEKAAEWREKKAAAANQKAKSKIPNSDGGLK